ncbi:hypothetical protein HC891_02205 [Candidatus Gracilibacteria bacterium]|nr:hypothetical protein [Candidatus Gracilibacteria bacterium]
MTFWRGWRTCPSRRAVPCSARSARPWPQVFFLWLHVFGLLPRMPTPTLLATIATALLAGMLAGVSKADNQMLRAAPTLMALGLATASGTLLLAPLIGQKVLQLSGR